MESCQLFFLFVFLRLSSSEMTKTELRIVVYFNARPKPQNLVGVVGSSSMAVSLNRLLMQFQDFQRSNLHKA